VSRPNRTSHDFVAHQGLRQSCYGIPGGGDQSVHRESSEGCAGSSKFHTVSVTGMVALP